MPWSQVGNCLLELKNSSSAHALCTSLVLAWAFSTYRVTDSNVYSFDEEISWWHAASFFLTVMSFTKETLIRSSHAKDSYPSHVFTKLVTGRPSQLCPVPLVLGKFGPIEMWFILFGYLKSTVQIVKQEKNSLKCCEFWPLQTRW